MDYTQTNPQANPQINPYEEKLKRLLGQVPNTEPTFTPTIYITRRWFDDEWVVIGCFNTETEAKKSLKDPNNYDEDESSPKIDDEHMYSMKTKAKTPEEKALIMHAIKNFPDCYWDDWIHC